MTILKSLLIFVLAVRAYGKPSPILLGGGGCGGCNPSLCVQVSCSYGIVKDNCGCCNVCMPGPGQPCSHQVSMNVAAPCGTGLSCNQGTRTCLSAPALPAVINVGVQVPMSVAPAPQQCGCGNNCVPSIAVCVHGSISQPSCGCCNQCASGPGELCGNGCGKGMQCQGNICMSVSLVVAAPAPVPMCGCASQGCSPQPQGCHFGIAVSSSCSCCKTCASGPGMSCTLHTGGSNCGHGLSCMQNTCQTTVVQASLSMGNSGGCGGCSPPPTNCMYGQMSMGSCGCKQCASGIGHPCGNGCAQGLQCMQNICVNIGVGMAPMLSGFSTGSTTCGGCGSAPIGMPSGCNCAAVSCPAISAASCQVGMVTDACGCCNVCAAAPGGVCGAAVGVSICSRNHYCNRGSCSPCSRCGK